MQDVSQNPTVRIEVEEALCLEITTCRDADGVARVLSLVQPDWMVSQACAAFWGHSRKAERERWNPEAWIDEFRSHPAFQGERFTLWFARLIDSYVAGPEGGFLLDRCRQLVEACRRRLTADAARQAVIDAEGGEDCYLERLTATLEKIDKMQADYRDGTSFADKVLALADVAEAGEFRERRISSGVGLLDQSLRGGFAPGHMVVIGARPSVGKSAFAQSIVMHNATRGRRAMLVSLEMDFAEVAMRLLSNLLGRRPETDRERNEAAIRLHDKPIEIIDQADVTAEDVCKIARGYQEEHGLDLLVIDYLQLLKPSNPKENREQQVASDGRAFKRLAGELKVPVIVLSQLNRQVGENEPQLYHLRESGAIEQDANTVILMSSDKEVKGELNLHLRKNRDGETDDVVARFDPAAARVFDLPVESHPNYNEDLGAFS